MIDFCSFIMVVEDVVSWMLSGLDVLVSMNLKNLSVCPMRTPYI